MPRGAGDGSLGAGGRERLVDAGQRDVDARAAAGRALDADGAAALLDDAVDDREAEAGAAADLLGRVERLEHARAHLFAHAGAGVDDAEARHAVAAVVVAAVAVAMVSWPPDGIASRALTARLRMTCSSWPASARTRASPARELELERHVAADDAAEQRGELAHLVVEDAARWRASAGVA